MAGVITASEPSWIAPFAGLSPRCFGKLVTTVRREGVADGQRGRPWSLSLEDRILLVVVYWRANLTMHQVTPHFGVSKSAADRIINRLGPLLALQPRKRFRKDTVLIVDGTLVPTRDHTIAEQSKNYRYSTAHQVVTDADTRLVVVVGRPLPAVGEVKEQAYPRSFHTASVVAGAGAGTGESIILCHAHYPWIAFAQTRRDWHGEEFLAPPPWAHAFTDAGFVVLSSELLATPLSDVDTSVLGPGEWREVRFYSITTLGGVLFNAWD